MVATKSVSTIPESNKTLRTFPKYISIKVAADYLGLSIITVRRMIKRGEIRASKTRRMWLVDTQFLDDYLENTANISRRRL